MKHPTSICHLTGREQHAILRLKNKIVELHKPLIIYLIGSSSSNHLIRHCFDNPRNDNQWYFSCDLLIVLPNGASLSVDAANDLKNISNDYEQIRLTVHPFDFVQKQLQEYSLFFCWIQRRAIVLYERDHSVAKLPEPVHNMKQYDKQVHDFFIDYPGYENYLNVQLSPLPIISSHQTKEKLAICDQSIASFKSFIKNHDPKMVSRNIRSVLLEYTRLKKIEHPINFQEILCEFMELIEVFDSAEDPKIDHIK